MTNFGLFSKISSKSFKNTQTVSWNGRQLTGMARTLRCDFQIVIPISWLEGSISLGFQVHAPWRISEIRDHNETIGIKPIADH